MSLETATAKDGMVLKKCTCHVKQIARRISEKKDMEALLRENMAGDALVVLWLMQGIVWGKWKDGTLTLKGKMKPTAGIVAIGVLLIKYPDNTVTGITVAIGVMFLLSGVVFKVPVLDMFK